MTVKNSPFYDRYIKTSMRNGPGDTLAFKPVGKPLNAVEGQLIQVGRSWGYIVLALYGPISAPYREPYLPTVGPFPSRTDAADALSDTLSRIDPSIAVIW